MIKKTGWPLLLSLLVLAAAYPWEGGLSRSIIGWAFQGRGEFENLFCRYFEFKHLLLDILKSPKTGSWEQIKALLLLPGRVNFNYYWDFTLMLGLEKFFPLAVFYNLKIIIVWLLNAWGGYWLGKYLSNDERGGFLTGLFWGFSPFILFWINEGSVRLLLFFPLFLITFLEYWQTGKTRFAIYSGIILALSGAYYSFNLVFLGLTALTVLLVKLGQKAAQPNLFKAALLFFAAFFLAWLPFLAPMPESNQVKEIFKPLPALAEITKNGLFSPAERTPSGFTLLVSQALGAEELLYNKRAEYIPFGLLLLVLITLPFSPKKARWIFLTLTLVFGVFSLGPYLKVGGIFPGLSLGGIPLPYQLLLKLPYFHLFYWPTYCANFIILFLAALLALNFRGFSLKFPRFASWGVVFAAILLLLELFLRGGLPITKTPFQLSSFYVKLSQSSKPAGIIEMPFTWDSEFAKIYQTIHLKPVLGSAFNRFIAPQAVFTPQEEESNSFLGYLTRLQQGKPVGTFKPSDLRQVKLRGYRRLVFHPKFGLLNLDPERMLESQLRQRFDAPVFQDREIMVFQL